MVPFRYHLGILCGALTLAANAQVTLIAENDIFSYDNNDRGFSHGSHIGYDYGGYNFFVEQSMYTPEDISDPNIRPNERPYAGVLLLGVSDTKKEGGFILSRTFAAGVLGPDAQCEFSQKYVHERIGSQEPMGWDHQLPNEVVAESRLELGTLISKGIFHLYPYAKTNLGTLLVDAGVGATVYVGSGKQFINDRIMVEAERPKWFFNLLAGAEEKAVGFNATIDGNAFHETDLQIEREPLVAEFKAGLEAGYGTYLFGYTMIVRTNEYKDQPNATHFGSVRIGF